MPTAPVVSFRPVLKIDGTVEAALGDAVDEMLIVEHIDGLYRCEVRLANWGESDGRVGYLWFGGQQVDFGKRLVVEISGATWFDGRITAIEADYPANSAPALRILAEDRLQDLRMVRRTRTFNDVSDADIIQQIASDHGLTPDVELSGPTWKQVAQANQSDLAFLRERVQRLGGEIAVSDTTLRVRRRAAGSAIRLVHGVGLHEFSVIADLAHQRTAVSVNGWDPAAKEAVTHESGDDVLSSEVGGDRSGPATLQRALGERKEAIAHLMPLTSAAAENYADAHMRAIGRRFVVGRGICDPHVDVRAGATVELAQLGPWFNGSYHLTEVRHGFDLTHGLRTEFTAERPGLGNPA